MARTKRIVKQIPTIWRCPDDLWHTVMEPVLMSMDPPARTGRKRIDQRKALDGVIYVMRTGCQWHALPAEFGDYRSVHRTFQRWIKKGAFEEIWSVVIGCAAGVAEAQWTWQSADGFMGKARLGGIMSAGRW